MVEITDKSLKSYFDGKEMKSQYKQETNKISILTTLAQTCSLYVQIINI